MISIDTNVLLRRLLQDDPEQSKAANRLFDSSDKILITDVVLAETVWTLKGKRYSVDRDGIIAVVMSLLQEPAIVFESAQAVWSAVNDFADAKPIATSNGTRIADFADALIVRKSQQTAKNVDVSFKAVYTFDQGALQLPGTRKP